MRSSWTDGLLLSVGTLTVVPVSAPSRVDRSVASRAMSIAPLVGLALGGLAAAVVNLGRHGWSPLLIATLAVGGLAVATRGLHLDGLADTADGLGSARPAADALAIMRRSDIGPFGVIALVFVLLLQVGSVAEAPWWALAVAVPMGRLGITIACSTRVPAARNDGLGASVAASVPWWACAAWAVVLLAAGTALDGRQGIVAVVIGLGTAVVATAYAVRRLGGVTGDVLGAVCELTTTATLLVLAVH